MELYKGIFIFLLIFLWIFLLVKEAICQKYNTREWQQHFTCKLGLHVYIKRKISILRMKQCKYCGCLMKG